MIRKLIPRPIRRQLSRLPIFKNPVLWANWGPLSHYLANKIQPLSPPVAILSIPRSGSSWAGEILGTSPTAMYLREPMTQTHLKSAKEGSPSFFEFNTKHLPESYDLSAKHVFSGQPSFDHWITTTPQQWQLSKRVHRRVVAKEVNPFMIDWLVHEFRPKIVFLIRHPVAIASSFNRMGWNGKQFEFRIPKETLKKKIPHYKQFTHSFWAEHGAFQAFLLNEILRQAKGYEDFRVVKYEDLCADPINMFKDLYQFAQLEWDETVERKLQERTQPVNVNNHSYSTQRNSAYEMEKWKHEVAEDKIQQLKEAYLSFNPAFYRNDW